MHFHLIAINMQLHVQKHLIQLVLKYVVLKYIISIINTCFKKYDNVYFFTTACSENTFSLCKRKATDHIANTVIV